ncbi:MAG: putative methyltransferase [Candidatus Latescibacteria bacterium]|nr:putative methyltransferase [Candidatus Latescibacterota bacterium]
MSYAVLEEIAGATRLREGAEGVRRVLWAIHRSGRIDLKTLARQVHLPLPVVAAIRREMERRQLLRREKGLVLGPAGQAVLDSIGVRSRRHFTCPCCRGRKVVPSDDLEIIRHQLTELARHRPVVDVRLDQAHSTPETALRRALLMYENDALEGRRILVLGDDDLVSLALGLVGRALAGDEEPPSFNVTVLELDRRLVEYIGAVSQREKLGIDCLAHDLRRPLPPNYVEAFDSFTTDPPYTEAGFGLFVSRAVQALRPGVGQQGFISFAHRGADEMLAINAQLAAMGFCLQEVLPAFNNYEGAQVLAGSSQMLHVQTSTVVRSLWREDPTAPIYTAQRKGGGAKS